MPLRFRIAVAAASGLAVLLSGCYNLTPAARAERWLLRGDAARAFQTAEFAVKNDPESADAYRVRGAIHDFRGEWPEAERDLLNAASLDWSYQNCCLLARLYGEMGEYDAMNAWFDAAVDLAPERSEAYAMRGMFELLELGKMAAAEQDLSRAAELSKKPPGSLHAALARIQWLRGDYAEAVRTLSRPEATPPEQLEYAWMLVAAPAENIRDPRKARALASRIATTTAQPNLFSVLAQSYAAEGDWRGAAQAMSQAEELLKTAPYLSSYDRDYYRAFLAAQRRLYRARTRIVPPEPARKQLFLVEHR